MHLLEGELRHGIATRLSGDVREQKKGLLRLMYRYIKTHPERVDGRRVYFETRIFSGGYFGFGLDEIAIVAHFYKRNDDNAMGISR